MYRSLGPGAVGGVVGVGRSVTLMAVTRSSGGRAGAVGATGLRLTHSVSLAQGTDKEQGFGPTGPYQIVDTSTMPGPEWLQNATILVTER